GNPGRPRRTAIPAAGSFHGEVTSYEDRDHGTGLDAQDLVRVLKLAAEACHATGCGAPQPGEGCPFQAGAGSRHTIGARGRRSPPPRSILGLRFLPNDFSPYADLAVLQRPPFEGNRLSLSDHGREDELRAIVLLGREALSYQSRPRSECQALPHRDVRCQPR